jgi:hypothetical protein
MLDCPDSSVRPSARCCVCRYRVSAAARAGIRPDYVVSIDYYIHPESCQVTTSRDRPDLLSDDRPPGIQGWQGPASPPARRARCMPRAKHCRSGARCFRVAACCIRRWILAVRMGARRTPSWEPILRYQPRTHAGWPAGLLTPSDMPTDGS